MGCGTSNTAAVAAQASDSSIVDSEEKKEQAWSNKKGSSNKRKMEESSKSPGPNQPKRSVSFPAEDPSEATDSESSVPKLTRKDTPHVLSNLPAPPIMKTPDLPVQKEEATAGGTGSAAATNISPMKQKPEAFKPLSVRQPLSLEGTESQIEFFKKMDKRIEQGADYDEEKDIKK